MRRTATEAEAARGKENSEGEKIGAAEPGPSELTRDALDLLAVTTNAARNAPYGERANGEWVARWVPADDRRAHVVFICGRAPSTDEILDVALALARRNVAILGCAREASSMRLHFAIAACPETRPTTDAEGNPTGLLDDFPVLRPIACRPRRLNPEAWA